MKVLFVASECSPFIKTGGLADVIGSIPKALATDGIEVKVLIPAYRALQGLAAAGRTLSRYDNLFGGKAEIKSISAEELELLLLVAPHLYDRGGNIYVGAHGNDWPDNHLRFAGLSFAGAEIASSGLEDWHPDVVNAHDWQTGLLPAYIRQSGRRAPPVVMTIHNIAFQGLFNADQLANLWLQPEMFTLDGVEYYGMIGFLKAGIALADKITTVSPSYANELLNSEQGMGLEGLLAARSNDFSGILNGIDMNVWNPETDPHLIQNYSWRSLKSREANKREVERRFGLRATEGPLFCVISRLTAQKGLDLLLECLPKLVACGASLALLGSGEHELERRYAAASHQYPDQVGVIIGFDEPLSHLMQAGCDAVLVPSRFEPCGLTQLYGLRYGALPVVAQTGGLADTVIDANEAALAARCATGFQFLPSSAPLLSQAIERVCKIYQQPRVWASMVRRAMRHPVGWDSSAADYRKLYDGLAAC